ncbi:MAG: hypothetical protein WC714_28880 [Candidatus Obscuribacterales bacterium]|jgi:hypothetical protein
MNTIPKAKARIGYGTNRIIVDNCPYCHRTHYHNLPVGEGLRMADCYQGEYILDFTESNRKALEEK